MILTITLNPAIDKLLILNRCEVHKLHRLEENEISMAVPGGKGVNIALTLKMLGSEVIATGFAGGHTGHLLCESLRQKGVTTSFIFTESETRTNTSILDRNRETLTEINDQGKAIADEDLEYFFENYQSLLHRVKFVVIAGSLPPTMPIDTYRRLIEMAKKHKLKVFLHTAPKNLESIISVSPFFINPDMRSSHELNGKPLDGIDQFIKQGIDILAANNDTEFVVFTHRIENVVAVTRNKAYIIRPKELNIVNMLGYADAYLAGFIYAYSQQKPLRDILKFASATGLTNVEELYKEIQDISIIKQNLSRITLEEIE